MTVSMVSTDEATRGIDDLRRCTEVGRMVQAGSAGGSYENGETKSDDRNRMNHRRGTRANNGKERSLKSRRPKHKRSSCSKEDTGERRDNYYRQETRWEAPGLGVPGVLDTLAGKKDVGDNGLGKMVSAKEIAQSRQDISGGRRSMGVGDWGSDSYTVHSKVERSTSKSSPRISTPKTTLATRTAYHPVEKGAQYSSSTVLAGQISRRRERRSENRFLCQTGAVEDGDQHAIDRKQQAKRLALEIAKLRSALRVSNSDLAAERKVRARLEVRLRRAPPFCHGNPLLGVPFGRRYRTVQVPSLPSILFLSECEGLR